MDLRVRRTGSLQSCQTIRISTVSTLLYFNDRDSCASSKLVSHAVIVQCSCRHPLLQAVKMCPNPLVLVGR